MPGTRSASGRAAGSRWSAARASRRSSVPISRGSGAGSSRRPRTCSLSKPGSEVALVEEHHRAVGLALAIGKAGTLIEGAGRGVVLTRSQLHPRRTLAAGDLHRRLEERPAEALAAL